MPPASAVNNSNNSNNNAANNALKQERLRGALKIFIQKERQRKKEEFEAKVEEERLRKEREARERQNDMTLEETRGQIAKLDQKLTELRNQKQQLFLQLKKVLNEDENRKKQQKDSEMFAMQALQAQQANAPPPQVFLPPVRSDHHQMPIISKPTGNNPIKRGRSPSPPTHQVYYKTTGYSQPKHDDGRRNADYARVLWNKPPTQYQSPGTLFYQTTSNAPPPQPPPETRGPAIIYNAYNLPLRQGYPIELQPSSAVPVTTKSDQQSQKPPPTQVYHINLDQPRGTQSGPGSASTNEPKKSSVTMKKIADRYFELKMDGPPGHGAPPPHQMHEAVYTSMPPGISLHPNVMPIAGNQNQGSKSVASITQGYASGRGPATAHEQQMARQQPITVMQGQPGQPPQHYPRRLFP